jgi:dihydrofolate reductase
MRPFSLIVSCSENRVIGRAGHLPWSIPEDTQFFDQQTAGQIAVLGRICFETWPGATRAGRRPVVVTRDAALAARGLPTAPSFAEALERAAALTGDIYVCGGERIYAEAIAHPAAERLYLTLVHAQVDGDRHFPDWTQVFPREIARREGADPRWRYTFLTLGRP